ncbi:MAG: winged helix-turn-helix domain-containing protein [Cyanobacteria bacterium]|nr:winged helix-turn-helix domain-containing protein [Cyanobacteriota bacterium]MDW8200734.1 winged helix-turn-helix domain-containing protein [Cyanobacteriota bacterium SKYGB_h_bin112]
MSNLLGHPIHLQRGREYLRAMELRRRCPRSQHQETDPVAQAAWKPTSRNG